MDNKQSPDEAEILAQLKKIIESSEFKRSSRISNFLTYIVRKSLSGEEDKIKGYTIGVEVFGKPEDFNPDTDAAVRVEATRLRIALTLYYHGDGENDPVIIRIPKGGYKPAFFYNTKAAPTAAVQGKKPKDPDKSLPFTGMLKDKIRAQAGYLVMLILLAALGILAWQGVHNRPGAGITNASSRGPMAPIVAVLPFYAIGGAETEEISADMTYDMIQKLSAFDSISALGNETISDFSDWQGVSGEIGGKLNAHYLLEGTVRQRINNVHVSMRLLDLQQSTYIWSYDEEHEVPAGEIKSFRDDITSEVVSRLASPYGVIQSKEASRISGKDSRAAGAYRCVLETYVYANNQERQKHKEVRACLEDTVKHFPNYVEAWSLLSYIYGEEYRFGFNKVDREKDSRTISLLAAQKAIDANPNSARAHQYIAEAAKLYKDKALIKKHTRMALSLNPNDSEVLANAGWTYGELGEWEKSKELAERAIRLNPGHPRWYNGILFAYYFETGSYDSALLHALKFYQPDDLFSQLALAVSYAGLSRYEEAQETARDIEKRFPGFTGSPRETLHSLGFEEEFIEKLLIGAEAAGLKIPPS